MQKPTPMSRQEIIDIKLKCLELALEYNHPPATNSVDDLLNRAEEYLNYVLRRRDNGE